MGNRILKKLLDVDTQKTTKTFYTRDAQGNVLSIYENGKQKKYRDGRDNIYYFNAQNELIDYTDATGKNLFTFNIKGKLIFEEGKIFVCIDKIQQEYGNCADKIELTDITDENLITQTEVPIYGSDRIGTYNPPSETNINSDIYILNRSYKRYELKDHLGNVRVTVSDSKRVSFVSETLVFSADIKTYTDYYAFGMEMVGRNWSEGEAYRQGYNGKENDKDFGEGVQDYGMRVSDTQTCRFFSVDPITAQYPELTPYQFASNRPIDGIDLDGLEWQGYGAGFGMSRNQMRVYQESRDHDIKNPKQYTAEEIAKANSFFADFIPIISQTKAGTEVATGIDPITKKPASQVMGVIGLIPFGKIIGKGAKWIWNGITSIFKRGKKPSVSAGKLMAEGNIKVDLMGGSGESKLGKDWVNYDLNPTADISDDIASFSKYFPDKSIKEMVTNNPRADFLENVAPALADGATITVRGNISNKYFKKVFNEKANGMDSFEIVSKTKDVPNLGYKSTEGAPLEGVFNEIILKKK